MKGQSKYINTDEFQSPDYPMTYIIGARGVGKTVNSLARNLKRCFEQRTQFIYLRRYQTELDQLGLPLQLLSDITGHKIDKTTLKDESGRLSVMLTVDEQPVCYLLALSTASKYKSNDYSNVDNVIYDEFIDIRGRELKNETNLFMNFMMTVYRDFSKYRVLFLANATNIFNCYFLDFEILPHGKITKYRDKGIKLVMYRTSDILNEERNNSVLAKQVQFLEGDDGSSLDNCFTVDFEDFIHPLTKKAVLRRVFRLQGVDYGCFYDESYPANVISPKFNSNCKVKQACTYTDISESYPLMPVDDFLNLKGLFFSNRLFFTNAKTRTMFMRLIKKGSLFNEE